MKISASSKKEKITPSLGVIAAYRWEVAFLLGRNNLIERLGDQTFLVRLQDTFAVLAISGPGPQNAFQMACQLAQKFQLKALLSIGFAGALDDVLQPGDIVLADRVIDTLTATEFLCQSDLLPIPAAHHGILLSTPGVVGSVKEKRRLRTAWQALAVDMESSAVARAASAAHLAFGSVKAITDSASQSISIDFPMGQREHEGLSTFRVVRNGLRSWQGMKGLWSLGAGARLAAKNLAQALSWAESTRKMVAQPSNRIYRPRRIANHRRS